MVCKRKRSQKKSTRAVPARHPAAAAQTRTRRLFSPRSAHAPANSLSLKQCGLVRTALPPVPSPLSGSSAVCAVACGGWCADLQLGFFRQAICESSYEFDVFHQANAVRHCKPNIKLNLMFNIRSTPHPARLRRAAFPSR